MATLATLGGSGTLFVGEDKTFRFEILTDDVPVDMSGWTVKLFVLSTSGRTLIDETATITGVYNADRDTNTQRASITVTDTEMDIPAGTHKYSVKRTDDASETVLLYGPCIVESATQV